jgi:hypothetical protein
LNDFCVRQNVHEAKEEDDHAQQRRATRLPAGCVRLIFVTPIESVAQVLQGTGDLDGQDRTFIAFREKRIDNLKKQ